MMFGWYEMDLALGCVRYMPPLQGLGFLWGLLPRALPWAIALCPVGAEDGAPLGRKTVPRWGGRPVPLLGAKIVRRWGGSPCGVGGG
jgi:hypothetical protein